MDTLSLWFQYSKRVHLFYGQTCLHWEHISTPPGRPDGCWDHKASQRCKVSNTTLYRVPALGIYYPPCPPYQDPTWPFLCLVSATLNSGGKGKRFCSVSPCTRKKSEASAPLGFHVQSLQQHVWGNKHTELMFVTAPKPRDKADS